MFWEESREAVYGCSASLPICSPGFPGISGPGRSRSRSGGLGLDSGMALSSGSSGTPGFAFGTAGNSKTHRKKKKKNQPWQKLHVLNYNDGFVCIGRDYFLLSFDISFIHREGYLCMCWKHLRSEDESTKRGRTSWQTSVKTRPYPCPVVKKWAHIYISSSFSKHLDRHFQRWHFHECVGHSLKHTHTHACTHICTHLEYTYNTLRPGRMRVK